MTEQADVIVLGMGVGGEHVAGRLARAGLAVVAVEAELVGGECAYWACVPTKMMVRAGGLLAEARRVPRMAGTTEVVPDFGQVADRIRHEATDDWDDTVAADRFHSAGGRLVRGRARLAGPGRVVVDPTGEEFGARMGVVVATGSVPVIPPVPGLAGTPYWTNREAVATKAAPRSLIVLGGGAVGLELGQLFARFGTAVTVVEAQDRLLPLEEPESGQLIREVLERAGVAVHTSARATEVDHRDAHDGGHFTVRLDSGTAVTAERLLVATGRRPDLAALGLATVGLDPSAKALPVDERLLAAPALWGVGDVTGVAAFTHVAMYQAELVARGILGEDAPTADYRALPRVTFTDPEVGSVGLTELAAQTAGVTVRTGLAQLPATTRGWIHKAGNEGLVKLVADADRGVLVGATAAGPHGGEVLYGLAVAVQAAVPVDRLRDMIYAYPTFHRGVQDALSALG